ncbi:MAG: hypothetical protein QNJ92_11690 [Alphaproteobacteria bacterium]|nr:hypothetical protein [Alphaproteobacteria bacterium]
MDAVERMSGTDPKSEDEALRASRRRRNIATAVALAALVVLFYVLAMVKMSGAAG